jgi:hypothetical protein
MNETLQAGLSEKRRKGRRPCGFQAAVLDGADGRPAGHHVRMVDISPLGLGVLSSLPLGVGDLVGVRLGLSGGCLIEASCRVRWASPDGFRMAYGLEFEGLGFLDRLRLGREIEGSPFSGGLPALTLQLAATLMAACVLIDATGACPGVRAAALAALPFLLMLSGAALALWGAFQARG